MNYNLAQFTIISKKKFMPKIYIAQNNTVLQDFEKNSSKIIEAIKDAKAKDCSLVVTSELALPGYPPTDLLFHPSHFENHQNALDKIIKETDGISLLLGCIRKNEGAGKPYFNSCLLIQDQKIIDFYDKWLLPTYDVFDERRYFEPGTNTLSFDHEGKKIGVTICEDIWQDVMDPLYSASPIELYKSKNLDLLINLSSSPFVIDKLKFRYEMCKSISQKLHCPLLYVNQVGAQDDLIFDGNSFCLDQDKLYMHALSFKEDHPVLDLEKLSSINSKLEGRYEQIYKALTLGIRDYFHKLGFKKAVLGLSGGIDSALVATLAAHALGKENILAISLPSRFSSEGSILDADHLARNLDIEFKQVPIEQIHRGYLDLLEPHFEDEEVDITEENLQSRIRGMILMAFANKFGYLTLSCSNKSEIALGYATLYGDSVGALTPIADLTKTDVFGLCDWINKEFNVIPQIIIDKEPSAELRPDQKDVDSLPPYDILDPIIVDYVEHKLSIEKIAQKNNQEISFVKTLIKQMELSEYKRRQYPTGLKVTSQAYCVGWRYPIVKKTTG